MTRAGNARMDSERRRSLRVALGIAALLIGALTSAALGLAVAQSTLTPVYAFSLATKALPMLDGPGRLIVETTTLEGCRKARRAMVTGDLRQMLPGDSAVSKCGRAAAGYKILEEE